MSTSDILRSRSPVVNIRIPLILADTATTTATATTPRWAGGHDATTTDAAADAEAAGSGAVPTAA